MSSYFDVGTLRSGYDNLTNEREECVDILDALSSQSKATRNWFNFSVVPFDCNGRNLSSELITIFFQYEKLNRILIPY